MYLLEESGTLACSMNSVSNTENVTGVGVCSDRQNTTNLWVSAAV